MPIAPNDKSACAARHAALANKEDFGIRESTRVANSADGNVAKMPSAGMNDAAAIRAAVQDYLNKGKMKVAGPNITATAEDFTSSKAVVQAIKDGKLSKKDALNYVEKFKLVDASKMDELTVAAAYNILVADVEEEEMHNKVIAEVVSPGSDWHNESGEKMHHMDQPKPDGKAKPESQFPSTVVSKESDVNQSSPEDKGPKPDGSVNPQKWMAHEPANQASEVNKSKPEDPEAVKPTKVGNTIKMADDVKSQMPSTEVSNESDVNTAKPEDGQPNPDGSVNPKGQMPSTEVSNESDVNSAKPEDKQPEPKKAQMMPPMDMGAMDKPEKPKDHKPDHKGGAGGAKNQAVNELKEALDLLLDVTELLEGHNFSIKKKGGDKAEKGEGADKSTDKPEAPKAEKKDNPFEKKDEKKDDKPKESPFPKSKDEAPMPPVMAYKVELIKDEKSPLDSYYVASLGKNPCFTISLRQAFLKSAKQEVNTFHSEDYAREFEKELNTKGAKEVFNNIFGSRGVVIAQMDKLPDDKFNAPAKPMNVSPQATQDMANDDTAKTSFAEIMLEVAAPIIASKEGATAQEFVDEFRDIFSDETKAKQFEGRLSEKVETQKKGQDISQTPDAYKPAPKGPAPETGAPAPAPTMPTEMKAAISKMLPAVKATVKENEELKVKVAELEQYKAQREREDFLKARATATKKVAEKKASYGLIDSKDINDEALRLAKLSDEELHNEVKILENSLRIAKNVKKKDDCTITESNNNIKTASVTNIIPSQLEDIAPAPKFTWSKGFLDK